MKINKLLIAAVLAIAIAAPIVALVGDINLAQPTTPEGERTAFFHGLGSRPMANQSGLASLERADAWLNSPPLTASALRGKVVLVHFWTYTCINWLRTQPYLRAWAEKYKDKGLVVIGVHTPEFRIRKEPRQRPPGGQGAAGRLSCRGRQRTCDLARLQESTIGRRNISSMRKVAFGTRISARVHTNSRRWSFSVC